MIKRQNGLGSPAGKRGNRSTRSMSCCSSDEDELGGEKELDHESQAATGAAASQEQTHQAKPGLHMRIKKKAEDARAERKRELVDVAAAVREEMGAELQQAKAEAAEATAAKEAAVQHAAEMEDCVKAVAVKEKMWLQAKAEAIKLASPFALNDKDSAAQLVQKEVCDLDDLPETELASGLKVPEFHSEAWLEAPKGPNGTMLEVGFRIGWERISEVSTVQSTCWINIAITYYWTDPRLVGWKGDLPPLTWGPELVLTNKCGKDMDVFDEVFALTNGNGRIKRGVVYQGTIVNTMDLTSFPFDTDEIELDLHTSSHYRCLDSSRKNMLTTGKTYDLYPISDPNEGASRADPFCRLENADSGRLPDWDLIGYTYRIDTEEQVTGIESTDVFFQMLVARKTGCAAPSPTDAPRYPVSCSTYVCGVAATTCGRSCCHSSSSPCLSLSSSASRPRTSRLVSILPSRCCSPPWQLITS